MMSAFAALAVLVVAGACSDAATLSPDPRDAGVEAGDAGKDARPRRDAEVFCEPGDPRAAVMPATYAGRTNPVALDPSAIARGRAAFANRCATCHGAQGRGDGPERPVAPPPADLTAIRKPDDYLFWRISEGGNDPSICSAMPGFAAALDEADRWDLVAFVASLSSASDGGDGGP